MTETADCIRPGSSDFRSHRTLLKATRPKGANTDERAVPVLFIAGFGRSGSTLLDRLLGSSSKFHSGGELVRVWDQGLAVDPLCSCGVRFSDCPFWRAVGSNSFSSLRIHEVDTIVQYLHNALRARNIWRFLSRRTRSGLVSSAPANFFDITARLYQGVRDVSAQQVVVDSSKLASYLVLLAQIPSVNVRVVHLVRDPRAVAHSWLRPPVADPEGQAVMPRFGVMKSAVLWLMMNAAVEWHARSMRLPYVRVRYEDLVKDPAGIARKLGSEFMTELPGVEPTRAEPPGHDVDLDAGHICSGNPMRFQQGRISIVEDADWKADPRSRRAIVTAITFPLMWRYGYGGLNDAAGAER